MFLQWFSGKYGSDLLSIKDARACIYTELEMGSFLQRCVAKVTGPMFCV